MRRSHPTTETVPSRLPRGAPVAWPRWVDAASDRWWGLTPRVRTAVLGVLVGLLLAAATVRALTSPFGPPTTVLLADGDLAVGTPLDGDQVRTARWPRDLVPPAALTSASGTLTARVPDGAALTAAHVTEDGLGGVVGSGRAAVPLPAELVPQVPAGTRVQVVAADDHAGGTVLAADAEVVTTDGASVWLGVTATDAPDVAAAGLRGGVTVVVLPAG